MHLILIGMPGSGKTTLGRALAAHFGLDFVDLDAAIVARAGQPIPAIFAAQGEAHFREVEAATLRAVLREAPGPLVLATGGGTPCFHHNLDLLQAHGLTLWLDEPVAVLADRLQTADGQPTAGTRPLLAAAGKGAESWLRETLARRREFYAQARLRCGGPACTVAAVAAQVRAAGFGSGPGAFSAEGVNLS